MQNTDKELLELAAKAIGTIYVDGASWDDEAGWNPLYDDGDALRLAVNLGIVIEYRPEVPACFAYHYSLHIEIVQQNDALDPCASTRRAIVRAAAEIGRNMK